MSAELPTQSKTDLPVFPESLVRRLGELGDAGALEHGYVRVETPDAVNLLFVLQGKAYSAGQIRDDYCSRSTISDFFHATANAQRAEFCTTDLPLFLCTMVLFRKQPVATIPSDLIDSESLIKHIRQTGRDAVLVIRRGTARSLVFCRSGEPAALYPAPDEDFPFAGSLAERIVKYVFSDMTFRGISLELYDEIRMPAADEAGKSFAAYLSDLETEEQQGGVPAPRVETTPNLLVWLGDRVVERVAVTRVLSIGREGDNDVVLNNLSVSRHHARVTPHGESLLVEDLGSQNGLVIKGKKMGQVEMVPGDELRMGKYKLVYPRYELGDAAEPASPSDRGPSSSMAAVEQTMALMPGAAVPVVEHNGRQHKVKGLVFTIGKDSNAHIRIGGLFVAPVHLRIFREPNGTYRVEHVAGRKALRVNGRTVKNSELRNGDELVVGSHHFLFTVPEEGGAPEAPKDLTKLGP